MQMSRLTTSNSSFCVSPIVAGRISGEGFDINRTATSQQSEVHLECSLSPIRKLSQSFELSVLETSFDSDASGEDVGFPLAQTMDSDEDQSHAEDFEKFLGHMANDLCHKDEGK